MDIYTLTDMTTALQNAQYGDVLPFNIKNDIPFTSAVLINKSVTVILANGSGNEAVALAIAGGGTFRHFTTGGASIDGITMSVGPGVLLDGGGTGGGIQLYGSACLLALEGCTVAECRNSLNGGGILVQGNAGRSRILMNNALIANCQAGAGGGGVFASACDIEMNGGEISGNRANNTGGGICTVAGANTLGCAVTMNGGKIANNTVSIGDAGGIGSFDTRLTIDGGEISGNTADGSGGGIYAYNQSGNANLNALIIKNSLITGNRIRNFGGGIRTQNALSEFTIINSVVSENSAVSAASGSNQGGGIYHNSGLLTIIGSSVSKNEAGASGGGIFVNLSSLVVRGGAEISENAAAITAGGIYGYQGANITIDENSKVIDNHALCGGDPENASRGGGGIALLAYGFISTLTVRGNSEVSGNTSVSYGGGIWTYPTYGPEVIVNIEGAAVEGNTANYGGGISTGQIPGYTPLLSLTGASVSRNHAAADGGGVIAMGSLVSVSGSAITGNSAGRDGGGIFTDDLAHVTVDAASIFGDNTAGSYVFWTLTSGGDSDIYRTHTFTDRFSTFTPVQTPPLETWFFTNAYNNYDIYYAREPLMTVTVNITEAYNPSHILHTAIIDSFLGATVTIPPRNTFTDINGAVWVLQPPDQPAQTIRLTDPNANYEVTFYNTEIASSITVTELYADVCGRQIMSPTQTLVVIGDDYRKAAPGIPGYTFVGYRIHHGPLQTGQVAIIGISADTVITFVYKRNCVCLGDCLTMNIRTRSRYTYQPRCLQPNPHMCSSFTT